MDCLAKGCFFSIQSLKLYNNGSVLAGKGGVRVEDCVAYACYTQFVVVQACMNGVNYTSPRFHSRPGLLGANHDG